MSGLDEILGELTISCARKPVVRWTLVYTSQDGLGRKLNSFGYENYNDTGTDDLMMGKLWDEQFGMKGFGEVSQGERLPGWGQVYVSLERLSNEGRLFVVANAGTGDRYLHHTYTVFADFEKLNSIFSSIPDNPKANLDKITRTIFKVPPNFYHPNSSHDNGFMLSQEDDLYGQLRVIHMMNQGTTKTIHVT